MCPWRYKAEPSRILGRFSYTFCNPQAQKRWHYAELSNIQVSIWTQWIYARNSTYFTDTLIAYQKKFLTDSLLRISCMSWNPLLCILPYTWSYKCMAEWRQKFHATFTLIMEGGDCLALSADKAASLPNGQDVDWVPELVWILLISQPLTEAKLRLLGNHTHSLNRTLPELSRSSVSDYEIVNCSYHGAFLRS
jgi:hypothetical protein